MQAGRGKGPDVFRSWISQLRGGRIAAPFAPQRSFYAVGDLHGRTDLLDRMLTRIAEDAAAIGQGTPAVIFLGDYVDRGGDSAGVVARVRAEVAARPGDVIALKGNHEAMMLAWLEDPVKERRWLRVGGVQTLASYGIGGLTEQSEPAMLREGAEQFSATLPTGEAAWIRALPTHWQSGNMACVHAGADPARSIESQDEGTLIWGHRAFMTNGRRDDIWVIHGHTVVDAPEVGASRISVDTGAYYTDRLTACRVTPDGELAFLEIRGRAD